jgi:hypothetical protein
MNGISLPVWFVQAARAAYPITSTVGVGCVNMVMVMVGLLIGWNGVLEDGRELT